MKARSDSKLKNLPEERQEQIIAWAKTPKSETCTGGFAYALEQLAADGLKVSLRSLSEFYSWWELKQDFSDADTLGKFAADQMKAFDPANAAKAEAFGQFIFTGAAVRQKDPATFVAMQRLKLDKDSAKTRFALEEQKLKLAGRRVAVLEKKLERAGQIVKAAQEKGGMTPETLARLEKELKML